MLLKAEGIKNKKTTTYVLFDRCLQLAIMSGHFELGEIIKNHKDTDIGKFYVCILSIFRLIMEHRVLPSNDAHCKVELCHLFLYCMF